MLIKATGNGLNREDATTCTFQLFAEKCVFKARKQPIWQHVNWKEYGEREVQKIITMILEHTDAVLDLYKNKQR